MVISITLVHSPRPREVVELPLEQFLIGEASARGVGGLEGLGEVNLA